MPSIASWLRLASDTVTVEPYTGQDKYRQDSYGTGVPYRARVLGKVQKVTTVDGDERISTVTVYLMGAPVINSRDRLTLPAGWGVTQPRILAIGRVSDQRGPHHTVIYT